MRPKLASQIVLSPEELQALGCVAVECAFLEGILEQYIWWLCGVKEDIGRLMTTTMMMERRLDLVSELVKPRLSTEAEKQEFADLIASIRTEASNRNTAIHGRWGVPKLYQVRGKEEWLREGEAIARRQGKKAGLGQRLEAKNLMQTAANFSQYSRALVNFLYLHGIYPARLQK